MAKFKSWRNYSSIINIHYILIFVHFFAKIKENEYSPCDILILKSSEPKGLKIII